MQNAMVSLVSGSEVRTTHLTGTFTDFGIELAQLFKSKKNERSVIKSKLKLRATIITCFLSGALAGAYIFMYCSYRAFFLPAALIVYTLFYDVFRLHVKRYYRRLAGRIN